MVRPWMRDSSASMAKTSQQPFKWTCRQRQREELVEQQENRDAKDRADDEVDDYRLAPERRGGRGKQNGGRGDKPAAERDDRNQHREAAENEDNGLGVVAFTLREAASPRHDQVGQADDRH